MTALLPYSCRRQRWPRAVCARVERNSDAAHDGWGKEGAAALSAGSNTLGGGASAHQCTLRLLWMLTDVHASSA